MSNAEKSSRSGAKKTLAAARESAAYQKQWFRQLHQRVNDGEKLAYINADVPMELLRAMDIPYVVNQWWAAICGAKGMTPRYFSLLEEAGYPTDLCSYCATALAESYDKNDAQDGPWGGLPRPGMVITRLACDCQGKIFQLMGRNYGAELFTMENTLPKKLPVNWWELDVDRWEELYDPQRLDFAVAELWKLVEFLERQTGKKFSIDTLEQVMQRVNRQEQWYLKTRDLIAASEKAPVSVVDTINAVMQAQWHRGTAWAENHARSLYEEVLALYKAGHVVTENEKYRLMWLGRGLWHDFAFYQNFEEKYGAVFMWSMYLAMGADAYIRHGVERDPMRALAARFIGMEDFLHCPPWNAQWFLKEAKHNRIDGVVYMAPDNCTQAVEGARFIVQAMEGAGIPVLQFVADPVDPRKWSRERMSDAVGRFITEKLEKKTM